jgi:precorrin-2/cobalt-factor-2 C20-methyltransferase
VTIEASVGEPDYDGPIAAFYEEAAERLAAEMQAGRTLAVLCDGDPFFYGSFMHLWRRLSHRFPTRWCPASPA